MHQATAQQLSLDQHQMFALKLCCARSADNVIVAVPSCGVQRTRKFGSEPSAEVESRDVSNAVCAVHAHLHPHQRQAGKVAQKSRTWSAWTHLHASPLHADAFQGDLTADHGVQHSMCPICSLCGSCQWFEEALDILTESQGLQQSS